MDAFPTAPNWGERRCRSFVAILPKNGCLSDLAISRENRLLSVAILPKNGCLSDVLLFVLLCAAAGRNPT